MRIDWFTIGAQVVNFLILVWLMKRFLYKPILNAIDAREKRVADELADAHAEKSEAQEEREEFKQKNEELDAARAGLLRKAKDEAKAERQRLLDEARKAADALRSKLEEALRNERDSLNRQVTDRTREEVFAIARQALSDLAGTSLEERMVEVFVRRLRELQGEEKKHLVSALKVSPRPVLVRTAFDLPAAQHASIEGAVKETLGPDTQVQFETAPDLVSGIELTSDGQKVGWSIADYLTSLQKDVEEILKEKPKLGADKHGT